MIITIADISIQLKLPPGDTQIIEPALEPFISSRRPDYTITLSSETVLPGEKAGVKINGSSITSCSEFYCGNIDIRTRNGELKYRPGYMPESLTNFLKIIYTQIIISKAGLVLHAAGLVKDSQAHIFFGPSGSGKSTITNLSYDCGILSDELVAVISKAGIFEACGMPDWKYGSKYKKQLQGPFKVSGLYSLIQDRRTYLTRMSRTQAAAEVFTRPAFLESIEDNSKLLTSCTQLTGTVPCYQLHFTADSSLWRQIEREHEKQKI